MRLKSLLSGALALVVGVTLVAPAPTALAEDDQTPFAPFITWPKIHLKVSDVLAGVYPLSGVQKFDTPAGPLYVDTASGVASDGESFLDTESGILTAPAVLVASALGIDSTEKAIWAGVLDNSAFVAVTSKFDSWAIVESEQIFEGRLRPASPLLYVVLDLPVAGAGPRNMDLIVPEAFDFSALLEISTALQSSFALDTTRADVFNRAVELASDINAREQEVSYRVIAEVAKSGDYGTVETKTSYAGTFTYATDRLGRTRRVYICPVADNTVAPSWVRCRDF